MNGHITHGSRPSYGGLQTHESHLSHNQQLISNSKNLQESNLLADILLSDTCMPDFIGRQCQYYLMSYRNRLQTASAHIHCMVHPGAASQTP